MLPFTLQGSRVNTKRKLFDLSYVSRDLILISLAIKKRREKFKIWRERKTEHKRCKEREEVTQTEKRRIERYTGERVWREETQMDSYTLTIDRYTRRHLEQPSPYYLLSLFIHSPGVMCS